MDYNFKLPLQNPQDFEAELRRINAMPSFIMSDRTRQKKLKKLGEAWLSMRAAEGLTDEEVDQLLGQAMGSINASTRGAKVGINARNAAAGISPSSGLAMSQIARADKGSTIAKGKAKIAVERMDKDYQNQAMAQLMNTKVEPSPWIKVAKVLGQGLGAYVALQTGGASTALTAAGTAAAATNAATKPAYQQQGPEYDTNYMDFYFNPQKQYEEGLV